MPNSDPYIMLEKLPKFELNSDEISDGEQLPITQVSVKLGGRNLSPHLEWSGFPDSTKSFVVTVFDPDAPVPGGFWHWAVYNIPASVNHLESGSGSGNAKPSSGLMALYNDGGTKDFVGASPPAGTGRHKYYFVVYALDTEKLELDANATPTKLAFDLRPHVVAWAKLVAWYEQ